MLTEFKLWASRADLLGYALIKKYDDMIVKFGVLTVN